MKKLFATLCLILAAALPWAAHAEKVSFATTEFPPYVIVNGNALSGFYVDIARELCRRLGLQPDIQVLPWSRGLEYVKTGRVDGILMPVYTPERTAYMYFTEESSGRERISILTRRGSGIQAKSLDDLKGMMVGTVFGYSYGKEFDSYGDIRKDVSPDNYLLIRRLALGRYSLVASDEGVLKYLARKIGSVDVDTVLVLYDNPAYIGFSMAIGPRGKTLAERFSNALRKMKQDGTYARLEHRYFG